MARVSYPFCRDRDRPSYLYFREVNGPVPNNITLALPEAIFISSWADQGRKIELAWFRYL